MADSVHPLHYRVRGCFGSWLIAYSLCFGLWACSEHTRTTDTHGRWTYDMYGRYRALDSRDNISDSSCILKSTSPSFVLPTVRRSTARLLEQGWYRHGGTVATLLPFLLHSPPPLGAALPRPGLVPMRGSRAGTGAGAGEHVDVNQVGNGGVGLGISSTSPNKSRIPSSSMFP